MKLLTCLLISIVLVENIAANEICPICLKKIDKSDLIQELCCGHLYCSNCIALWVKENNFCPYCIKPLSLHSSQRFSMIDHGDCYNIVDLGNSVMKPEIVGFLQGLGSEDLVSFLPLFISSFRDPGTVEVREQMRQLINIVIQTLSANNDEGN